MSNNARQVIKDNLIPALTSLGGTASTADIKAEILRMTNTVAEDFGRTKPNKKYPEGRLSFVEKFTLVSVEYKRKGMVFTPAYAHLSLDQNAVVAGKKKPLKVAENHKSSKVKAQSAPVEVETVVVKTGSSQTGEELVAVQSETFDFGDVEIDNQGNVGYVEPPEPAIEEMIAEAEEIVEQVESASESEEAPVEPDHVMIDENDGAVEEREYIEPTGRLIEAWLDRDNALKCGYDENGREWKVALTEEEMSRYNVTVDSEEDDQAILEAEYNEGIGYAEEFLESSESDDDDVVVASTFAEGEVISADSNVEYSEEMSDDSSMAEELIAEAEEVAEADSEDNSISVSYDLGDIFDEEEEDEGLSLLLEKIEGHDLYGKIEGNEVYLSMYEDGRVTLKFEESIPSAKDLHSDPEKADKLRNKLQSLKGDLEGYATLITRTKEARVTKMNHSISSNLGCFGDDEWAGSICNTCALKNYCQSTETLTR